MNFMKKYTLTFIGLFSVVVAFVVIATVGCSTAAKRTTYNTIATVEQTATVAVDSYYGLVLRGMLPTNSVPTVSKAFNDLQAAGLLAAITSQNGTNALAPASLVLEASQLGALIKTIESNK